MAGEDEELLSAVRNSDRSAFETLFRKYYGPLFRQVWYRCKDRDLAEDFAQEAFVRIWIRRAELKPRLPLLPFLITISLNLLRDHSKHAAVAQRHMESLDCPETSRDSGPDELADANLLQERILDIVNSRLSEKCRSIFILSRIEGKDNAEIAALLSISKRVVENQLYRALKILRKDLSRGK